MTAETAATPRCSRCGFELTDTHGQIRRQAVRRFSIYGTERGGPSKWYCWHHIPPPEYGYQNETWFKKETAW